VHPTYQKQNPINQADIYLVTSAYKGMEVHLELNSVPKQRVANAKSANIVISLSQKYTYILQQQLEYILLAMSYKGKIRVHL